VHCQFKHQIPSIISLSTATRNETELLNLEQYVSLTNTMVSYLNDVDCYSDMVRQDLLESV